MGKADVVLMYIGVQVSHGLQGDVSYLLARRSVGARHLPLSSTNNDSSSAFYIYSMTCHRFRHT